MWANKLTIVYATMNRVFCYLKHKESYLCWLFLRRIVNQILEIWYNQGSSSGVTDGGKILIYCNTKWQSLTLEESMFPKALGWWVIHALPQNTVGEVNFLLSVFDIIFAEWHIFLFFTKHYLVFRLQLSCQIKHFNELWMILKKDPFITTTTKIGNIFTILMARIKTKCQLVSK